MLAAIQTNVRPQETERQLPAFSLTIFLDCFITSLQEVDNIHHRQHDISFNILGSHSLCKILVK